MPRLFRSKTGVSRSFSNKRSLVRMIGRVMSVDVAKCLFEWFTVVMAVLCSIQLCCCQLNMTIGFELDPSFRIMR